MSDPVTPEMHWRVSSFDTSLECAEDCPGCRIESLAAQLEAAQKAIAQLEADVEHRDEIIQRLRSVKAA